MFRRRGPASQLRPRFPMHCVKYTSRRISGSREAGIVYYPGKWGLSALFFFFTHASFPGGAIVQTIFCLHYQTRPVFNCYNGECGYSVTDSPPGISRKLAEFGIRHGITSLSRSSRNSCKLDEKWSDFRHTRSLVIMCEYYNALLFFRTAENKTWPSRTDSLFRRSLEHPRVRPVDS